MVRRAPRADVAILLITFGLTVFADLVVAVNIGVILAMLHFLRRMATSVEVRQATQQELTQEFAHRGLVTLPPGVLVFTVEGPFFFGAVENFERALAGTHSDPENLIIRLNRVPFIDITGLQTLEEVIRDLQHRGVNVMLSEANTRVAAKLHKAGIIDLIGGENRFATFDEAINAWQGKAVEAHAGRPAQQMAISDSAQAMLDTSRDYFLQSAAQRSKGE
jgi:SulP family sulfate permease